MKKIFFTLFFLITFVNYSYGKDFFTIGETKIFYESPQGCVNSKIFGENLNNYFNLNNLNHFYVTYVSDETALQLVNELYTNVKCTSNVKTLSIGNDKEYTDNISQEFFINSIKNQEEAFVKNNNINNIKYIGKRISKNHATWTMVLKNKSVHTVSAISYVFIKNKLVIVSTRGSFIDKKNEQSQIKWVENASLSAIQMLFSLN